MANDDNKKSIFVISDDELAFKLHKAAVQAVKKLIGNKYFYAIVNTGVGKNKTYKQKSVFTNKKGLYEVGIAISSATKNIDLDNEDLQKKEGEAEKTQQIKYKEENEARIKEYKDMCIKALNEYFTWFAGEDILKHVGEITLSNAQSFNLEDPTSIDSLIKNYNDYTIPSIDNEKFQKKINGQKPVVSYKVGYSFVYESK